MEVEEVAEGVWIIHSDSGNDYTIFYNPRTKDFVCSCPHYAIKLRRCKHIKFLLDFLSRRRPRRSGGAAKGGEENG